MQKFLNNYFKTCIQKGTHVTENGLTVSVSKKDDEVVLFVKMDGNNARSCLCMPRDDDKSCDRLIFYTKRDNTNNELICFLELKGGDLSHAVDQIINTYKYMLSLIEIHLDKQQDRFVRQYACICTHSSISNIKKYISYIKKLEKLLGKDKAHIKHVTNKKYDIGDFLREKYA
jgi:hypothetical protein